MKVLLVVHGLPPHAQGGSELYAELQARTLCRFGDRVHVLTREQVPDAAEYRVRTEECDAYTVTWVNNTFAAVRTFAETYDNPTITEIAAGLVDSVQPDVAHVHHLTCLSTGIVSLLDRRGVPCVFTLHDYWLLCHRGQLLDCNMDLCPGPEPSGCDRCLGDAAGMGPVGFGLAARLRTLARTTPATAAALRRLGGALTRLARAPRAADEAARRLVHMRNLTSHVTHFLAPSESIRARLVAFGVEPERITHAPYGFDHRPFRRVTRSDTPVLRLGFLGSLMLSKAPHLLLEAFSTLPAGAASLTIFGAPVAYHGDDSYRGRIEPLLEQPGVELAGPIAHGDVPQALTSLDVLVVPSVWPENSPLVIHEAFLAGVPVVGSDIGGIPELVSDGVNGLLFAAGDVGALSRALTRLVREPELLPTLRAGLPTVRTIDDDVRMTRQLYERLRPTTVGNTETRRAAVVLNYRTPDETLLTVRSLLASEHPFDDVVVVDNDRGPVCATALAPLLAAGHVRYIQNPRNVGFSGGMNVGIRDVLSRGATAVLLVNSDVLVPPDTLHELGRALDRSPTAGIAGPVVMVRGAPDRVASSGIRYHLATGRMVHAGYGTVGTTNVVGGMVDAVSGCVMLIRREVFDEVGLFDEDYFFSFEDLEFCHRAARAGYRTVLAPEALVYHEGGRSIGKTSPRRLYFAARNHLLAGRQLDPTAGWARTAARNASIVVLNVLHALTADGGLVSTRLAAVSRGTLDYLRGRFGSDRDEE